MKKTLFWIIAGGLLLVAFTLVPALTMWGRNSWHYRGYGMMGNYFPGSHHMMGGWFGFSWLFTLLLLGVVITGGIYLSQHRHRFNQSACSSCNKIVETDWVTCPYCSSALQD